jgi:hypothetical protein
MARTPDRLQAQAIPQPGQPSQGERGTGQSSAPWPWRFWYVPLLRAGLTGADWSDRNRAADPHAYYVAAADPLTEHLLGVWRVEGGQVLRLQDDRCLGLAAGPSQSLAESAELFSPHHPKASSGR